MYRYFSNQFQKEIEVIGPGEYYVTDQDIVISTVLGSCITVSLYDVRLQLGGMNHYMLPGTGQHTFSLGSTGKYGVHAMDLLYREMMNLGARQQNLEAKIFGGGSVLTSVGKSHYNVPENNINFAFKAVEQKLQIPVKASDVGGANGRKIYFFPKTGKVLVKLLGKQYVQQVAAEEEQIIRELRRD